MNSPVKQHLIDPEICIRCYTCESMCSVNAITHDGVNVVVDAEKCNECMDCIAPCPTGSIDNWRIVEPALFARGSSSAGRNCRPRPRSPTPARARSRRMTRTSRACSPKPMAAGGGRARAPRSASKPTINLYTLGKPAEATVQGNYRLTAEGADNDVRHIILDFGAQPFPVLEGQSLGIIAARHSTPMASRICRGSIPSRARATASGRISTTSR